MNAVEIRKRAEFLEEEIDRLIREFNFMTGATVYRINRNCHEIVNGAGAHIGYAEERTRVEIRL